MWPFGTTGESRKSCNHNWEKNRTYAHVYDGVLFEEDTGRPYISRLENTYRECQKCGEIESIDSTERKLYLSVEDNEVVERDL
jgi:hypothetical protein